MFHLNWLRTISIDKKYASKTFIQTYSFPVLFVLLGFRNYVLGIIADGSRQSCPSVDSLPLAFSFSLRGPSYPCGATGGRVPVNPASHIMTLQSQHPLMMVTGLNPSGVNPYSTPIPHYTPSSSGSAAASNHAPSPPPFGHLGESQESSSSPKLFSRDTLRDGGSYVTGRTGHRYSSFQHHHHPVGPSFPPPPVPTSAPPSSSRFSHFQSLGPSLVQAEAALWGGEQRRSGSNGGADPADKKSRGERLSLLSVWHAASFCPKPTASFFVFVALDLSDTIFWAAFVVAFDSVFLCMKSNIFFVFNYLLRPK